MDNHFTNADVYDLLEDADASEAVFIVCLTHKTEDKDEVLAADFTSLMAKSIINGRHVMESKYETKEALHKRVRSDIDRKLKIGFIISEFEIV